MSLFKKLFGGGAGSAAKEPEPEVYQGFRIIATPQKEGSQFRISARIEKEIAGETKTHQLIRADMLGDVESASTASVDKAKKLIDEQGDRLFG